MDRYNKTLLSIQETLGNIKRATGKSNSPLRVKSQVSNTITLEDDPIKTNGETINIEQYSTQTPLAIEKYRNSNGEEVIKKSLDSILKIVNTYRDITSKTKITINKLHNNNNFNNKIKTNLKEHNGLEIKEWRSKKMTL